MKYNPQKIEKKWQAVWKKNKTFAADDSSPKPKWYSLFEFPYPSGDGLHVGHLRPYVGMDIVSRKRRMQGYNVLYPIGWDAFGLPTENYAIKHGIDPAVATKQNTANFRRQMQSIGLSLDWDREIDTTDPEYYKWTQWMFLKFFEKGLAYKAKTFINWCPKDKIGLANEEAAGGVCDRCGGPVEKREKEQWLIRITDYADKLLEGLKEVDYIPQAKIQQENWIGRSEGAEIDFLLSSRATTRDPSPPIRVFTTRPDTLFGATYLVLAPEHPLVSALSSRATTRDPAIQNWNEVQKYVSAAKVKSEMDRTAEGKEKTGVELKGVKAINPATKEEIPVWISDFVVATYGTGAIMSVPAHDQRDFEFATKFNLPVVQVVSDDALLINSSKFNGTSSQDAKKSITEFVGGKMVVKYKLRDWVFSRQRYWGEPIPLVHCEKDGWVPVPEKDLPVKLPKVKNYQPRDDGQSPLASVEKWVNTKCPTCKGPAKRETDTMPNWAGSSWYFLAYLLSKEAFKKPTSIENWKLEIENLTRWLPVDWYNGGMEHTVLHLLYSRFWNRFLFELGLVPTAEPYKKRTSHAVILAEGGVKMSKSKGNVINPDDLTKEFGADALRTYEMFIGPFTQTAAWDPRGILGTSRFLEKVWRAGLSLSSGLSSRATTRDPSPLSSRGTHRGTFLPSESDPKLLRLLNKTIKKVGEDIEQMNFNTAVSAMMIFINEVESVSRHSEQSEEPRSPLSIEDFQKFLKILSPFAPHITEELNSLSSSQLLSNQPWPEVDETSLAETTFELIIQVNGKVRGTIEAQKGITQSEAEKLAATSPEVKKWLVSPVKRVIYVPNRLINLIV